MSLTYLVTGGCGFIGSHLVDALLEKGHRVRVIDNLCSGSKKNLSSEAEFFFGSIADTQLMDRVIKGVDGIFHLAALVSVVDSIEHWHSTHLVNCSATVHLFEMAKGIPIVLASSAAVYGNAERLPLKEDTIPAPLSPYAVDKLSCELHANIAWYLHHTPSISCRFFNVYGPRQNPYSLYAGVIAKFMHNILHQEPVWIYGDGNQERDFIYVKDVVRMLIKAMEINTQGARVYNFCTGKGRTINEVADLIGLVAHMPVQKKYTPARGGDARISYGDPTKTLRETGAVASTLLEEGLRELMQEKNSLDILQ